MNLIAIIFYALAVLGSPNPPDTDRLHYEHNRMQQICKGGDKECQYEFVGELSRALGATRGQQPAVMKIVKYKATR